MAGNGKLRSFLKKAAFAATVVLIPIGVLIAVLMFNAPLGGSIIVAMVIAAILVFGFIV